MSVGAGEAGELVTRLERDANACGAAELDETFEAFVAALTGDAYVFKLARTGADGLLNWVKTVQNFHELSLSCRRGMSSKAPTLGRTLDGCLLFSNNYRNFGQKRWRYWPVCPDRQFRMSPARKRRVVSLFERGILDLHG